MRKPFLECGKIVSTHGVLGEMRVQPWCDSPEDLEGIKTLYFDGGAAPAEVLRARAHKNVVLLKLRGVDTVEQAQALRLQLVQPRLFFLLVAVGHAPGDCLVQFVHVGQSPNELSPKPFLLPHLPNRVDRRLHGIQQRLSRREHGDGVAQLIDARPPPLVLDDLLQTASTARIQSGLLQNRLPLQADSAQPQNAPQFL